jgi:hypothetical protein
LFAAEEGLEAEAVAATTVEAVNTERYWDSKECEPSW